MPQKQIPITEGEAVRIEQHCDKCGKGVFRLIEESPTDSSPRQWLRACSHCKREVYFTFAFPIIKYRGKEFQLAESLKFHRKRQGISDSYGQNHQDSD